MIRQVIRYQTKPEATKQNAELIQNVFRELKAAAYENEGDNDVLTSLPAFAAFQNGGEARRASKPDFTDVTVVGNYRMLAD